MKKHIMLLKILILILFQLTISFNKNYANNSVDTNKSYKRYQFYTKHDFLHNINNNYEIFKEYFRKGYIYTISFFGKYHTWNFSKNTNYGIDPLFFYDIPIYDSTIQNFEEKQNLADYIINKPIPLKTNKTYTLPSPYKNYDSISFNPFLHQGIRLNNRIINDFNITKYDSVNSEYQIRIVGNDDFYTLQLLDIFSYDGVLKNDIANNYGNFKIYLNQEILKEDTCETRYSFNGDKLFITIKISDYVKDTNLLKGIKNLLREYNSEYIRKRFVFYFNGFFYCLDNIICDEAPMKKFGILFDRSNTMIQLNTGKADKIEIAKNRSITLINELMKNPNDEAFLISFSDDVYYDIDWTNNKETIINTIQKFQGKGRTVFYKALIKSLEKLDTINFDNKALIVYTDAIDQPPPEIEEQYSFDNVIQTLQNYSHIPIYFVVIPDYNKSRENEFALNRLKHLVNTHKNSIIYYPEDPDIAKEIEKYIVKDFIPDLCCDITAVFDNPCSEENKGKTLYIELWYSSVEDNSLNKILIPIRCE